MLHLSNLKCTEYSQKYEKDLNVCHYGMISRKGGTTLCGNIRNVQSSKQHALSKMACCTCSLSTYFTEPPVL